MGNEIFCKDYVEYTFPMAVIAVVVYFILSRLLHLVFSANFRPTVHAASRHGTPSLTSLPKDGGVSCFHSFSGKSTIQLLT